MVIDVTGVELTPGYGGKHCHGNGAHEGIECCCDECDYLICCQENYDMRECLNCKIDECSNAGKRTI